MLTALVADWPALGLLNYWLVLTKGLWVPDYPL